MAKVTNSKFISFIKAYGPWANNEMQFEEYVRKNSKRSSIDPLEYQTIYHSCLDSVKDVLSARRSHIILICGCAGDGKTHLLGQLFERAELLNLGSESFEKLLESSNSILFLENVNGFNLTVVGDLSQIPENSEEEQRLYSNILRVIGTTGNSAVSSKESMAQQSELVLIAGNNGKILEKIDTLLEKMKGLIDTYQNTSKQERCRFLRVNWPITQYQSSLDKLKVIQKKLKHSFIEHYKEPIDGLTLIDMSNRVNKDVVKEIFSVLLEHKCWENCNECDCREQCPILSNRKVMLYPWVQERLLNVLHLLQADSFHLTVRTVQSLIVNALLGRGFESSVKNNDLTCLKIKNNIEAHGECTFTSNVYDNLLGLNFKPEPRLERDIFRAMNSLKLGQHTSKVIDDFLFSKVKGSKQYQQFIEQYDKYGIHHELQEALEQLRKNSLSRAKEGKDELVAAQELFSLKLQALRRVLFFNLGASLDQQTDANADNSSDSNEQLNKWKLGSPYLMTCYPHAREYFELERLVEARNYDHIRTSMVARNLILALNRMFTELYTSGDDDCVYIPANHINNLSILYSGRDFKFKAYAYNIERSINLELPYGFDIPVLRFVDMKHSDDENERTKADLVLTPYMFECLMQIADGVSCLCLPRQAVYEVQVFKNKIFSILEKQISTLFDDTDSLLSSLRHLEVDNQGKIIDLDQINSRM